MSSIIDQRKIAIHECCHAIVNTLFKEYLKLNDLFLSKGDSAVGGQLGANFVQAIRIDGLNTYTATGIVWLAGIVGDTIMTKGLSKVLSEKEAILSDPGLLDWNLGGGDYPGFNNNASFIAGNYNKNPDKYLRFCISYLLDFLTDERVWDYVEKLADLLLSKSDLKLQETELSDFFQTSGFNAFIESRKASLIERLGKMESECTVDDPNTNPGPDCPLF